MPVEMSLDKLAEGAVLAADVLDARQNVLLSAGTKLTKAHISLVRRRGIQSVMVQLPEESSEGDSNGAPDPTSIVEALEKQERAFAKVKDDPLMAAIYLAAKAHLEAGNLFPG